MAGYIVIYYWLDELFSENDPKRLARVAILSAFTAIVYYAVVFPIITTVAHVVAVLIGIGLFFLMRSIHNTVTKNTVKE